MDHRSDHEILLDIERRLKLNMERLLMDLYDRIIAAVTAIKAGDTGALDQHIQAIDAHLSSLDASNTTEDARLDTIEAGLNKIADAVTPANQPSTTQPSAAANPGESAPIPASGAGSETHGQVDTPVTTG